MSLFVALDEAKRHLRLPCADTSQDDDLAATLADAEAIILSKLNRTPAMQTRTAAWDATTVPLPAKRAILLELGELWLSRGDDPETPTRLKPSDSGGGDIDVAQAINGLLRQLEPLVLV